MREVYVVCCLELGRQCTEVFFTGYRCLLLFESRQVRVFWGSQKKLKRNILLWSKVYRHNMQNMYTARLEEKKKGTVFCWTVVLFWLADAVTAFISVQSCIHFSPRSCTDGEMRESGRCVKSSPAHPKDSQWGSGLDSVVTNPCVKMMSRAPWTTLSARWNAALSSWNMPVPSGKKTIHWLKNLAIHCIQIVSWPNFLGT